METFMMIFSCLVLILAVLLTIVAISANRRRRLEYRHDEAPNAVSKLDTTYAGLDLSGSPRATYRFTMPDGDVLVLRTPTKALTDSFERIGLILQHNSYGNGTASEYNELYYLTAALLSHNTSAKKIDAQKCMEDLTIADLTEFLNDYMSWLTKVIESKN